MAIRPAVAFTPSTARAALPGTRWIRMNVKIMTPITTTSAWAARRRKYVTSCSTSPRGSARR